MPMAAQLGRPFRDDHEMAGAGRDVEITPRTGVGLASLVRLDHIDDFRIERG